jgi:hypothetical protein
MVKMPDHRLPKNLLFGELHLRNQSQGGQKKRYKDTLKASLRHCCIDFADWENVTTDRPGYCCEIGKGAVNFKKERDYMMTPGSDRFASLTLIQHHLFHCQPFLHQCQQCYILFRARMTLISHLRIHSKIY